MIVPQYWAEARIQKRLPERQVTVRRFGWSDTSLEEAQSVAQVRTQDALERILRGEKLLRREPKMPYNGADGVPIREEVVSRHGDSVVTRNSYGALCLNTPDVLFADIDFESDASCGLVSSYVLFTVLAAAVVQWQGKSAWLTLAFAAAGLFASPYLASFTRAIYRKIAGDQHARAMKRIERWLKLHPEWSVRLYRTPAGLRVMAMHEVFEPRSSVVHQCFKALRVDHLYQQMCRNQQCFRARVSAKPWRIGIGTHMRPRPGTWPVAPERLPLRTAWVKKYQESAANFAACEFLTVLGSPQTHPRAEAVRAIHDELSRAHAGLPLA